MSTKATLKVPVPESHKIVWTNSGSAVASRDLVPIENGYGVALADIAASATGVLATRGVYEIAKNTGAGKSFIAGEAVFLDVANSRLDKAGTAGAVYIGTAYKSAATADATMWVNLGHASGIGSATFTVDSTAAALNSNNGQVSINTGLGRAPTCVFVTVVTSSTLVRKDGYVQDTATTPGTIILKGVAAGVQLDAGDVVQVFWAA